MDEELNTATGRIIDIETELSQKTDVINQLKQENLKSQQELTNLKDILSQKQKRIKQLETVEENLND